MTTIESLQNYDRTLAFNFCLKRLNNCFEEIEWHNELFNSAVSIIKTNKNPEGYVNNLLDDFDKTYPNKELLNADGLHEYEDMDWFTVLYQYFEEHILSQLVKKEYTFQMLNDYDLPNSVLNSPEKVLSYINGLRKTYPQPK